MKKGGVILGLIGILIGAGGLTIGFIGWSSTITMQTELDMNNAYYTKNNGPYAITPAFIELEIPNLNVTFELSSSASVYLLFTCHASITAASGYSTVFFYFGIDGVHLGSPANRVGNYQGNSTNDYFSVSLQHVIENMPAGSHNVSIRVLTDKIGNMLNYMTLFVQTFAP